MKYHRLIDYLSRELGVRKSQVAASLNKTPALKDYDVKNASFVLEYVADPARLVESCKGKIPVQMYELTVKNPSSEKKALVFSHKIKCNGMEKMLMSTSGIKYQSQDADKCEIGDFEEESGLFTNTFGKTELLEIAVQIGSIKHEH